MKLARHIAEYLDNMETAGAYGVTGDVGDLEDTIEKALKLHKQSGIPAEDRYGRELDKVKPLAQYLAEYVEYELEDAGRADTHTWHELLEQALNAYESTENVKIRIERV